LPASALHPKVAHKNKVELPDASAIVTKDCPAASLRSDPAARNARHVPSTCDPSAHLGCCRAGEFASSPVDTAARHSRPAWRRPAA